MSNIRLRPDLKTAGGEVSDILHGERFAGTLSLVYRENDRIAGSIQLERDSLSESDKREVTEFLQDHIRNLVEALNVSACEVPVSYSSFDHIIVTDREERLEERFMEKYGSDEEDADIYGAESFEALEDEEDEADESLYYELVVVSDRNNRIHYHVYGMDREWVAEAFMKQSAAEVSGEVRWMDCPSDEEIAAMSDLIVSDFDENEVDYFILHHEFDGEVIETIELTHEDLLEADEPSETLEADGDETEEDYSVVLARDDGDALTYEIYRQSKGGLPVGTATVDIRYDQVTGFIDFRDEEDAGAAETISTLLMRELDKEREYETVSLTLLHGNEPLDEIVFETEQLH